MAHLDHLTDLSVADTKEAHLEDTRLKTELNETIDRRITNDTSTVDSSYFPRSVLRDRVQVIIGDARDLNPTSTDQFRKWKQV